MSVKDPWSVKQLVVATQELHASRLYQRFSDHDCFLIRTPKLDESAVAVLMGNGGQTFGLNVFLGESAMASFNALFAAGGEAQAKRAMTRARMIGYQMANTRDLSHDARRWLKKAKVRPSSDALYPDPMSIEPGKVPAVLLKDHQTRLLLHLVRGILAAARDKAFEPCGMDLRGRVLCVQLDQDADNPKVNITWESVAPVPSDGLMPNPTEMGRVNATRTDIPVAARFDLAGLDPSDDTWLVSLAPISSSVEGDDRQPYVLVVCSEQSQSLWPSLLMGAEPDEIIDALSAVMRGDTESADAAMDNPITELTPPAAGLPARMVLDSRDLYNAVCHAFEPLNIECINGEDNADLRAMFDDLHATFSTDMVSGPEFDPRFDDEVPSPDDLQGWKRVDGWLKDEIHAGFDGDKRFLGTRALNRYFGSDADPWKLFAEYRTLMIIDSYAHWFSTSYRSARNRPTLAEQWVADPELPDAVRILIKSAIANGPCIYRVVEADEDTGKITFANLFTGDLTIVTDFALSTCLDSGAILPAKLVPVGAFHFYFPAGPMMSPMQLNHALAFFDDQRLTPSPELFRDHPYLLGWLWDVIDRYQQQPVDVRNTDGHALIPHTATFTCSNRSALERFLNDQPHFEPEPDDANAWVWFRQDTTMLPQKQKGTHLFETQHQGSQGMVTLLGRLELDHDQITLHTNSRERLDAARAILERVPSLTLLSIEASDPTQISANDSDNEPTDAMPDSSEPDEEALEVARAYLAQHYRQWLDNPLPALRNKTPRQAAKDSGLRSKLATMIRAMPDPTGMGDMERHLSAPREMLLAELGLDTR